MSIIESLGRGLLVVATAICATLTAAATVPGAPAAPVAAADPFRWLEAVDGARAMRWVRAENAKTLGVLERDPRFATLHANALAIAENKDRLPLPAFIAGAVYNFWQDPAHVRGIWRRTTSAAYATGQPEWTTVLDLDALASAEHANWVWQGADCDRPRERTCLLRLSDGGEDATTVREFDLQTQAFVPDGFNLPKSKQNVIWLGPDELLLARDWGPGTLTASGYPYIVKRLHRGQALGAAVEVYRGTPSDVAVELTGLADADGTRLTLLNRGVTFFESEVFVLGPAGPVQLALPRKLGELDFVAGRLIAHVNEDWRVDGRTVPAGALVSMPAAQLLADPAHLVPTLIYVAGSRESLGEIATTRSRLIVTTYENVRGRAAVYTPEPDGGWSHVALALPDLSSIELSAADGRSDAAYLRVVSFLTPPTLWAVDAGTLALARARQMPDQFAAERSVVEQFEATSKDGTRVPYYVIRPRDMKFDGANPTILDAYGGFQVSLTPFYSGLIGKLWLERGGVFVYANIRGGGEFGPAWHEAGLKTHRQRIYDDFAAVGADLIARRITSPRRLGIEGGSNGGLLMGVEFNQHPELWNAVDIQVPLLDMLRFEQIAAGASWVGEYGSVAVPEERAFLASISPYHNVDRARSYPRPLVWTTTKDDRVGPQHARKFAARLAALGKPYYYYEVIEGGHGSGANLKQKAHTGALEMTYFTRQLMD